MLLELGVDLARRPPEPAGAHPVGELLRREQVRVGRRALQALPYALEGPEGSDLLVSAPGFPKFGNSAAANGLMASEIAS